MVVVSGGSWDFCNCMFCTRCGCKSSGCLDWGHWTVENRWVKGKKIQHCSSMYRFPLLSSGPVLRSSCGENLEKLTEGFPALTEQTRTAFWILASQSLTLRLGPLPMLAKPWAWSWAPQNSKGNLQGRGQPLRRLIRAGAKGMVICRCSLSMSSALLVMNLLKISLKDNEAKKKKKCLAISRPYLGPVFLY